MKQLIAVSLLILFSATASAKCTQKQLAGNWFNVGMGDYSTFFMCEFKVNRKGKILKSSACGLLDTYGESEDASITGTFKKIPNTGKFCSVKVKFSYNGYPVEIVYGINGPRNTAVGAGGVYDGVTPPVHFTMVR